MKMKKVFHLYVFLLSVFCHVASVYAFEGVVVKVIDGDSLQVEKDNGQVYEIRLYGIDTPEYKQPYSNKAKQLTGKLTFRQRVTVEKRDVDRYGRLVALVSSQGKLVNRELVRDGLAWYYSRYCLEQPLCNELELLETSARQERRGLWRDKNPIAPWDWKKQKHK